MTQIGLMIEGQDGLNWDRWRRILRTAEDAGFAFVFRSDHFTNPNPPEKDSLEIWTSLTFAATFTQRIEFGSLVSPVTFRHPAMTARVGAQIDDLSGGRLTLGLGAGWQDREHQMFGIPFYDKPTRHAMFAEALELTKRLLESVSPVSYQGGHFSLQDAILLPRPQRKTPILVGGNGPKKTLPLAAQYADEWNGVYLTPALYRERNQLLDTYAAEHGRDPKSIKRSLMTGIVYPRDEAALNARFAGKGSPQQAIERGMIVGFASQVIDQIGAYTEAGVQRFMMQWGDMDDIDGMERLARDVLPHFHRAAV